MDGIEKINKVLLNQTFECDTNFLMGESNVYEFEYKFYVIGTRKMISVGEYYDYIQVHIEILNIEEEELIHFYRIVGNGFNKEDLVNIFFKKDYMFIQKLSKCVGGVMTYFTGESDTRVVIEDIILSDELYNKIMDI